MSMSESRRRKLQIITRGLARGDIERVRRVLDEVVRPASSEHGDGVTEVRGTAFPDREPDEPPQSMTLEEASPGVEQQIETAFGPSPFWLIRRPLAEVSPTDHAAAVEYAHVMKGARERFDELSASAALCCAADARPEQLLFMDIESCGLAGCSLFLIGVMFWDPAEADLVFEQYFARDYSEEAAVIAAFGRRYADCRVLVTFNGKAFDMNMIRERGAFHAVEPPAVDPPHLDLLHESRRRWRKDLPNCRLQTLEKHLCGRHRVGDIPGHAIPDAYHRYVDTHDARQIRDILHHNLLDLLTMAQLVSALLTSCSRDGG